ncbi:hypothetical protein QA584_24830 [Anaerocolumna sp. AGMB13025]|uniref:hypothetical protein n=1 Tax=Anaerocolumna sp. AGMB13025 TaxID=3039116 RepID=UPI00241D4CB0|nr:hypothetical protein [Anaerocolumna sp. AGMB13025]WFR56800.1 hypothetical protein QA584_24830 [Anaerocolumna sp. AGMB13025]
MENKVESIVKQLEAAAQKLHVQNRKEAYGVINTAADTLFLFLEEAAGSEMGKAMLPQINIALIQCLEAMEQQDDVLAADVLEYEVIPLLLQLEASE